MSGKGILVPFRSGGGGSGITGLTVGRVVQSASATTVKDSALLLYTDANGISVLAPGTSSGNERYGFQALFNLLNGSAGQNTAAGYQALYNLTTGQYCTALGYSAGLKVSTSQFGVFIGTNAGNANFQSTLSGDNIILIGRDSGNSIDNNPNNVICIGGSTTGSTQCIVIGHVGSAYHSTACIAIGDHANVDGLSNVCSIAGKASLGAQINKVYFGSGPSDASPAAYTIFGSGAAGTDTAGSTMALCGGQGTGAGAAGNLLLQSAPATTTGGSQNSAVTAAQVNGNANLELLRGLQGHTNTYTSAQTLTTANLYVNYNSASAGTITLPAATSYTNGIFYIKQIGAGILTVNGGGANVDGSATVVYTAQYQSKTFVSDGTVWWIH